MEDSKICGLVGMAGDISFKEEKAFKDLLMLDVIRGKHSTGVASMHKVNNEWVVSVFKDSLNAVDYMDKPEFTTLMAKKHSILMGHNRWATRGAIIKENAHPFEFDNVVGAHNGSLLSTYTLFEHTKYPVDSQAAYSEMNANGVDSLWGKLNGAAALTWIDKTDHSLNFLRNDERPLFFTTINKGKTLVWASEFWMIHVACGRQGIELDKQPREVLIDKHYKFKLPTTTAKKDVVTWDTKEVKPYVAPKWNGGYVNYSTNSADDYDYAYNEGRKWLTAEGIKEGDYVDWTVDAENGIKDYISGGRTLTTIHGKTLKGTPVRIYGIDAEKHEDLVLEMWELPDTVFRSKVSYSGGTGLTLSIYNTEQCFYTTHDLAAASETKEEKKDELPPGVKYHKFTYKVGCTYCRNLVNTYYTSPGANICCEKCWKEEVKDLTEEARSNLKPGYRYEKRER